MTKPRLKRKLGTGSAGDSSGSTGGKGRPSLMESAQQIWMAGMGAFNRAQAEGGKLFETLVKEGATLEQKTRRFATGKVDQARDAVESTVANVRERAADTWDRLETVFEQRVSRALNRLGVPGRGEMQALLDRVEELNRAVRKLGDAPAKRAPTRATGGAKRKPARKAKAAAKTSAAKTPSA